MSDDCILRFFLSLPSKRGTAALREWLGFALGIGYEEPGGVFQNFFRKTRKRMKKGGR